MKNKNLALLFIPVPLILLIVIRVVLEIKEINLPMSEIESLKIPAALLLFLISAFLRLKRTQIIIGFIKPNSLTGNLQGSSVGYLANLILPFRLGEIVRAYFLSKKFGISLGFTIGAIALDRGLDLVMISISLIVHYGSTGLKTMGIFSVSELIVIGTGTLVFISLISAIFRTKVLLLAIQKISGLFNEVIRNRLRNSFWGLILAFQQILQNRKLLRNYLFVVLLSWIFTFSTILLLILSSQDITNQKLSIISYIPFISFIVLNGNDYFSSYSLKIEKLSNLISPDEFADKFLEVFSGLSWITLTLPYLIFGSLAIIATLSLKCCVKGYKFQLDQISNHSSKLTAPTNFLDSFFTKEKMIENIHRRSVSENFQVLEYFKGGSDAVTMLVQKSSMKLVQKVSGPRGLKQLRGQQEWLQNIKSEGIVKVLNSKLSNDDFELELEYIDNSVSLFEFIHTNPISTAKEVILKAIDILELDVYGESKEKNISLDLQDYLRKSFHERIANVASQSPEFEKIINTRNSVSINGELYCDLLTIFEKIEASEPCRQVLNCMQTTDRCHGDFTVDNILVRTETHSPVLIDPSDDNLLKGPLIDISRLMQSLLGGYEFLNQDSTQANLKFDNAKIAIEFNEINSHRYEELSRWLIQDVLPKKLNINEMKAVKFHVGIFFSRMLTHRYLIDEKTMYKYLAVSIRLLNEFYEEVVHDEQ